MPDLASLVLTRNADRAWVVALTFDDGRQETETFRTYLAAVLSVRQVLEDRGPIGIMSLATPYTFEENQ